MSGSDIIALSSMLIALVALGFSLWGYFVYDKPIKLLQKKKLQQEAIDRERASFNVSYNQVLIHNVLQIQNTGSVVANNIIIEIESTVTPHVFEGMKDRFVVDKLEPTEKSNDIPLIGDAPYRLKVRLTWDDNSGKGLSKNYFLEKNGDGITF